MSKKNGDKRAPVGPVAHIQITTVLQGGATNVEHPEDLVFTLHMLATATKAISDKIMRIRAEQAQSQVQTAPASALEEMNSRLRKLK